jgi:phospholipid/cholesterol/gamma-HCH transport system permease protein
MILPSSFFRFLIIELFKKINQIGFGQTHSFAPTQQYFLIPSLFLRLKNISCCDSPFLHLKSHQNSPMKFIATVGSITLTYISRIGKISIFIGNAVKNCFTPPFYPRLVLKQIIQIGYFSLPVVGLTAVFSGAVLAVQSYSGFSRFNAQSAIAAVVVLSITRELGPVLAGLMVAGRVGASIAAEIGTMKVTEQIDALTTLSTNPIKYLVVPRIIAGVLMLPFLVLIADIIGVAGGYLVSVNNLGFSAGPYLLSTFEFLKTMDVISGLVKAAFFGFIITTLGCYWGYNSKGGAEGVGIATTNAVVSSSIVILITNYIITGWFFG